MIRSVFTLIIIIHAIKSIPEDAARGHVLLGLEVGKVEAGGEDEDVCHHDEALQERHRHLDRHPLRRLQHVKLVLQNRGVHLVWSQWDTVIFLISMSHHLSSNFDINVPNLSHPLNTGFPTYQTKGHSLHSYLHTYILLYSAFF